MTRISSLFFLVALLAYYLPVLFKYRRPIFGKIHVYSGVASLVTMAFGLVMSFGTESIIKYSGFTAIILGIVATGFLMKDKKGVYRTLHIVFTLGFFAYLTAIIIL
ncbi:MAG: hypothetical protein RR840_03705 [Clostridium sp.]